MQNPTSQTTRGNAFPIMLFAGESRNGQGAAAAILLLPNGRRFTVSQLLSFATTEEAEYHGLLIGLRKAQQLGIQGIEIKGDSEIIFNQVNGLMDIPSEKLRVLYRETLRLMRQFDRAAVEWITEEQNRPAHKAVHRCLEEALGQERQNTPGTRSHRPSSDAIAHLIRLGNQATDADFRALGQILDEFSQKSLADLRALVPIAIQDVIALQWEGNQTELVQMYVWYLRGLPVEMAIRKVHLDQQHLGEPAPEKLPWEGQLLGGDLSDNLFEKESLLDLSFVSMGESISNRETVPTLAPLPIPPLDPLLVNDFAPDATPSKSMAAFDALNRYQDPFSTASETGEIEFPPKGQGKERGKETLPGLDKVNQLMSMIMQLSDDDKSRLMRELAQFPDLTNRILTAIADNIKKNN